VQTPSLPSTTAAAQHGLLTAAQLRKAELSPRRTRTLVGKGELVRLTPRLFRVAAVPETTAQQLLAAVFDAGGKAVVSHASALAFWGLPGFETKPIHVTRRRAGGRRGPYLADHVHTSVTLPDRHTHVLEGVPIAAPARALFDLAGTPGTHPAKLERAVDNAWADRLVSGRTLHLMLDELAASGRPGIQPMRLLLTERGEDYVPPATGLPAYSYSIGCTLSA
jgi:predicted transcriptional regulator of viral defense system